MFYYIAVNRDNGEVMKRLLFTTLALCFSVRVTSAEENHAAPLDHIVALQVAGGFEPGAVIRPTKLTPLELQIKELEFQLSGGQSGTLPDEVSAMRLREQLDKLYSQRPGHRERNPLDQGTNDCPGAVIPGVPFLDSGTTVGTGHDYNPIFTCGSTFAEEVIYSFTPTETRYYNISLLESFYDTYLYVTTDNGCPGSLQPGCSDNSDSGTRSILVLPLNAGQPYNIFVDGHNAAVGTYVLRITYLCDIIHQPGDVIECEENGSDILNGIDCDGGCNSQTQSWQTLTPSQTLGGLAALFSGGRDTDWYRLTVTEPCSLAITLHSECPTQVSVIDNATCPAGNTVFNEVWNNTCETVTFVTQCLQPGEYTVFIAQSILHSIYQWNAYRLRVDLMPCACEKIDSLTIIWEGPTEHDFRLDWFVPQDGYVRLYSTTDPNAVFPAGYTVYSEGFQTAGYHTSTLNVIEPYRNFLFTTECGSPPELMQTNTNSAYDEIE